VHGWSPILNLLVVPRRRRRRASRRRDWIRHDNTSGGDGTIRLSYSSGVVADVSFVTTRDVLRSPTTFGGEHYFVVERSVDVGPDDCVD
jgi:hypothetical protein